MAKTGRNTSSGLAPQDKNLKTLKSVIVSRDNDRLLEHLNGDQENKEENFKFTVGRLTCLNDADTLADVLEWGRENKMKIKWENPLQDHPRKASLLLLGKHHSSESVSKDEEHGMSLQKKKNGNSQRKHPIMIASQKHYYKCTELLYEYGYRIPQIRANEDDEEGKGEKFRLGQVLEPPEGDEDQLEKFIEFKAYSQPHYLSLALTKRDIPENPNTQNLERLDPLRRAFELAERAENYKKDYNVVSDLKKNYKKIQEDMGTYAHGVLTQCSSMEEVEIILEHKPEKDGEQKESPDSNFFMALTEGRKLFVSHPHFQQYLQRQMQGGGSAQKASWLWTFLCIPFALLTFLFFPLIVFADFFRKADILFVSPRQKEKENGVFAFFRSVIHLPNYRMITYNTMEMIYLALLIIMIWDPDFKLDQKEPKETFHWYTYSAVGLTIIFLIEDSFMLKQTYKGGKEGFSESFWNVYAVCSRLLLLAGGTLCFFEIWTTKKEGICLNRARLSGNNPHNVGMTLVACAIGLEVFKILRLFLLSESLGPIVICIISVMKDALRVTIVYLILFSANALVAWCMFKPFQTDRDYKNCPSTYKLVDRSIISKPGLFNALLFRILSADGEPGKVLIKKILQGDGTETPDEHFSQEFSHLMGIAHWVVYQILICILMINLLIAIMNNTYSKVWERADIEWSYSKSYYQAQFIRPVATFPTPFRWMAHLAEFIHLKKNNKMDVKKPKKKEYFKLLKSLLEMKHEEEYEDTEEDNMADLKTDLLLALRSEMKEHFASFVQDSGSTSPSGVVVSGPGLGLMVL